MSALSKCFSATVAKCTCEQINHPGHSCLWFLGRNLRYVIPGCIQYFLPLILIAPMRKLNDVTLDDLKDSFYNYCTMCFYIYWCSVASQSLSCLLYNVQQRYTMGICVIPISLGNAVSFLMPSKNATIVANSVMTMLTESLLMRDDTRFWRLLRNSPSIRTIIFMFMGATIMDVPAYIKKSGIFWFVTPAVRRPAVDTEPSQPSPVLDRMLPIANRVCSHSNSSCDRYIGSGISTYLKVGFGIETVRLLFAHFAQIRQSPGAIGRVLAQNMNWRLIAFLGTYAGAYRLINCLLNRRCGHQTAEANLIAAFVSAASYRLYPNRTLLAHAIVSAVRVAWLRLVEDVAPRNRVVQAVDRLPWSHLLHMFSVGCMYHVNIFYPYWSPSFLKKSTSMLSGGSYEFMAKGSSKALLGL